MGDAAPPAQAGATPLPPAAPAAVPAAAAAVPAAIPAAAGVGGAPPAAGVGGAPPAGAAGVPPAPPAPPAVPPRAVPIIQTYTVYYQTMPNDPYSGDYQTVEEDFQVPLAGNSRYAPNVLHQRVLAASTQDHPMSCMMLVQGADANDPGCIHVFTRVSQYPQTLVGPAQPWDNECFALLDDLVDGQFQVVPFPQGNFDRVANSHYVLDDAHMSLQLLQDPLPAILDHADQHTPNAKEIRTRLSTYIPFRYVPLFLQEPLTPRQAYLRLFGAAQADNKVDEIHPALNFLKLATMRQAANQRLVLAQPWPMLAQPQNAALVCYFNNLISRDIPSHPGLHVTTSMIAQAPNVAHAIDLLV